MNTITLQDSTDQKRYAKLESKTVERILPDLSKLDKFEENLSILNEVAYKAERSDKEEKLFLKLKSQFDNGIQHENTRKALMRVWDRNKACPCGSGVKCKKCCGRV